MPNCKVVYSTECKHIYRTTASEFYYCSRILIRISPLRTILSPGSPAAWRRGGGFHPPGLRPSYCGPPSIRPNINTIKRNVQKKLNITVVGLYINTMKTTFDFNSDLNQAVEQHGYI